MNIGVATNAGMQRDHNEDAYWHSEHIFVVCDGMGGHQAGEVASELAIKTFRDFEFSSPEPLQDIIDTINLAHQLIKTEADSPEYEGMGTTVTLALIKEIAQSHTLYLGHVGDSRAYLLRDQQLTQLTSDHSVVGELLRNGSLTEVEALNHPHRHIVTQALGIGEITIETKTLELSTGDIILLCSDGLTDVVDSEILQSLLMEHQPQAAADKLVETANSQGGPDNITVIIVEIP